MFWRTLPFPSSDSESTKTRWLATSDRFAICMLGGTDNDNSFLSNVCIIDESTFHVQYVNNKIAESICGSRVCCTLQFFAVPPSIKYFHFTPKAGGAGISRQIFFRMWIWWDGWISSSAHFPWYNPYGFFSVGVT